MYGTLRLSLLVMVITMSLQLANNNTNNMPLRAHQGSESVGNPYSTVVYLVIVQR